MTELISPLEQRRLKYAKKKVEFGSRQDEVCEVHTYMCVFVRVCVCVCVCIRMYQYSFTYTCTYVNVCMYVCLYLHFSILCCESVTGGAFSLH